MKLNTENEIWKPIEGFEGIYEISNYGRIKSLARNIGKKLNYTGFFKERILKDRINTAGYNEQILCKNGLRKRSSIHRLVFSHFNSHLIEGMVIDHIDNDKLNNFNENLQQISSRANNSKDKTNKSSKFTGVSFNKKLKKYQSRIKTKGHLQHLGYYETEEEASEIYQTAIKQIGL